MGDGGGGFVYENKAAKTKYLSKFALFWPKIIDTSGASIMWKEYPTPGKPIDVMSLEDLETLHDQIVRFLSFRIRRKEEETTRARNAAREAEELERLARMGVYRDWDKKRLRLKPVARKVRKPAKKAGVGPKKH
jgi:hypothetical protein